MSLNTVVVHSASAVQRYNDRVVYINRALTREAELITGAFRSAQGQYQAELLGKIVEHAFLLFVKLIHENARRLIYHCMTQLWNTIRLLKAHGL